MPTNCPRRALSALVAVSIAAVSVAVAGSTGAGAAARLSPVRMSGCGAWRPPVDGPIVRRFQAPASVYGPGHRGVDFAAPPGTTVRAAGDGIVAFAGMVAGSLHVVVNHPGGLRTTYAFLASAAVRVGQPLSGGEIVGTAGGSGPEHEPGVLHFGVRLGDRYVDPALLLAVCDLTELVRLVPVDEPERSEWDARHRGSVSRVPHPEGGVGADLSGALGDAWGSISGWGSAARDAGSSLAGLVWDATRSAARVGRGLAEDLSRVGRALAHELVHAAIRGVERSQYARLAELFGEVVRRTLDWRRNRSHCSRDSPPADGTGGSGHLLMAVGGIDGSGGPHDSTFALDTQALGYHGDEVTYYSYSRDGGRYGPRQTWGDLIEAGRRLGEQLKRMQRKHAGREVDLIAHSQGGVVVDVFLQKFYDASDPEYPPIGTVVTLSSPHRGVPLATAAGNWRDSAVGQLVFHTADEHLPVLPADAAAVRQIDEGSQFLRHLWDHPLPDHVDYTTIGGSADVLVPATQIEVPTATEVVVDAGSLPNPFDDHSAILTDPGPLRVVRAALERRPPPCIGFLEGIRGATVPVLITRFERSLGDIPLVTK